MKPGPPAVAELGLRLKLLGIGAIIGKMAAAEVTPPGLTTVTLAFPWLAIWLADTDAVNCVPLT